MSNAPPPMPADHQTAPRCECGHDAHPDGPCANAECRPLAVVGGKTVRVLCCESYRPATGERVDAEAAPKRKLQADVCLCSHFRESHCGPLGACIYCACKVFRSEAAPPRATTSCEHGRFAPPCGCFALRATLASSPRVDGPAGAMSGETDPYFVLDFCEGAIRDAITLEDGLDAEAGKAALDMIAAAKRARLRAAPSPEIGALLSTMLEAWHEYASRGTIANANAYHDARAEVDAAFATLTARAAEAEREPTLRELQAINADRSARWMAGSPGWTVLEIAGELAGEVGELANVCKKLRRSELGVPGNKVSDDELREMARDEMGDVLVVLMLTASKMGVDLYDAARRVFNAKSEQMGFPERFPALRPSGSGDTHPTETNDG